MPDTSHDAEYDNARYLSTRRDFFEKAHQLFEEFKSIKANENENENEYSVYPLPDKCKLKRISLLDTMNVHFLKNLHIINHPLFTEAIESRINFYNTVLAKMEEYLNDSLSSKPYDSFENENDMDTVMNFKARCLLVRHEFLELKEKRQVS